MFPKFPYFELDAFKRNTYKDLYFGKILKKIERERFDDPGFMNIRIKNLIDDIEDVSDDLEDHSEDNPLASPPKEIKDRVDELYQTAKRLGVYPD